MLHTHAAASVHCTGHWEVVGHGGGARMGGKLWLGYSANYKGALFADPLPDYFLVRLIEKSFYTSR